MMHRLLPHLWILLLGCAFFSCSEPTHRERLVLENLHIFIGMTGEMAGPLDLLIEDGQIKTVGKVDQSARRIDCTGMFAVPGLCDCHAHLAMLTKKGEAHTREQLQTFVEGGVTFVRDVGGPVDVLKAMHDRICSGEQAGPEIFYCGPMLERSPLTWAEHNEDMPDFTVAIDNRETVDRLFPELAAKGACMVKTFNKQDPEVYRHLVKKAAELSLRVVHDPGSPLFHLMPMDRALELGVTSIEHAKAPWPVVLTEELQEEHDALLARDAGKMERMPFMMKVFQQGVNSLSMEKIDNLCARMREKDAFLCPTLQVFAAMKNDEPPEDVSAAESNMRKNAMAVMEKVSRFLVEEFAKREVKFLVGHDGPSPEGIFIEMELLAECGVSEAEILKGATLYPARWMGVDHRIGSIVPGKEATLLLVDKNPLEDIKSMRSACLVMQKGKIVFQKEKS